MTAEQDWTVETFLGTEIAIFGRIRDSHGNSIVGEGRRFQQHDNRLWLKPFKKAASQHGGVITQRETRVSSRCPDREAGLLKPDQEGYYGGSEVEFADFVLATWGAVGGATGVIAFLKMLKEIKSFWKGDQSVEVTLKDGTKVKLSSKSGIDVAVVAIRALEDELSKRMDLDDADPKAPKKKRRTKKQSESASVKEVKPRKTKSTKRTNKNKGRR